MIYFLVLVFFFVLVHAEEIPYIFNGDITSRIFNEDSHVNLMTRSIHIESARRGFGREINDPGLYVVEIHPHKKDEMVGLFGDLRHTYKPNVHLVLVEENWNDDQFSQFHNSVRFAEPILHSDKSIIELENFNLPRGKVLVTDVEIYFYDEVTEEDIQNAKQLAGVQRVRSTKDRLHVRVTDNYYAVGQYFKHQPRVVFIQKQTEHKLMNMYGNEIIQGKVNNEFTMHHFGLKGEDQLVTVMDTGVDVYNCFFWDSNNLIYLNTDLPDHRKIFRYENSFSDHFSETNVGEHGTHVCGSAVGSIQSGHEKESFMTEYDGSAPGAKLYFQDIGNAEGELSIPSDLYNDGLFPPYQAGSRIHSNSWGCSLPFSCVHDCKCSFSEDLNFNGTEYYKDDGIPESVCKGYYGVKDGRCCEYCNHYDSSARDMDSFLFDNDEFLILVSAGNDGETSMNNSINTPATGRNVIAVGASQTSNNGYKKTSFWKDYQSNFDTIVSTCTDRTFNTIDDCCTYDGSICVVSEVKESCCPENQPEYIEYTNNPTLYNENNLASFSSRGYSWDSRIKPDLVVPGEFIMSANSQPPGESTLHCYDYLDEPNLWNYYGIIEMPGTSMATPLLAGTSALVRQYFTEGMFPTGEKISADQIIPSGMLIKAALVTSTIELSGTVNINGSNYDLNSFGSIPNIYQGWGSPRPSENLKFKEYSSDGYENMILDRATISNEESQMFRFRKSSLNDTYYPEFRVTLTWNDPPSVVNAASTVVNNIDLKYRVNSGTYYYGNTDSTSYYDDKNNIEILRISGLSVNDVIDIVVYGRSVVTPSLKYSLFGSGSGFSCENGSNVNYFCNECSDGCLFQMIGNNVCDLTCNNEACDFDGGDCDCSPGCNESILGNGQCDSVCDTVDCGFDNGDCICSPGCTYEKLSNVECDEECDNIACGYDNGVCLCAPGCFPQLLGNGECDEDCDTDSCNWDDTDCYCATGCSMELLRNEICDLVCNTTDCNYDNLYCTIKYSEDPGDIIDDGFGSFERFAMGLLILVLVLPQRYYLFFLY